VTVRSRRVPYWEAGAAYLPYGEGYFASASVMAWAFQVHAAGGSAAGFGSGGYGGFDGAGFDGGGFDGGGGDGGGGGN